MKAEPLFNNLDPSLLSDPEFKEDAVREVIITPLLTNLGYSPSGPNRVVRSKSLSHPFIYAGTRKVPVTLIPDYTLLNEQKVLLVLDAKRPTESVVSRENVQQVYSYAIHPEVKCQNFALCNGKELAVFSVDDSEPLLVLPITRFLSDWEEIKRHLSPRNLRHPMLRRFAPDFGCALGRLGLIKGGKVSLLPAKLNLFARLDNNTLTATSNIEFAERPHCVSFDFDRKLLPEMLACLPTSLAECFDDALNRAPFQAAAELAIELDIDTELGPEIEGEHENYRPLIIKRVIAARFNALPLSEEANDIPDHVFRLRKAYVLDSPMQEP